MLSGVRYSAVDRSKRLVVPLVLLAGCATGLRPPPVTVGIDLDGDARVDYIETIEQGRPASWPPTSIACPRRCAPTKVYHYLGLSRGPEPPRAFLDPCSREGHLP